VGGWGGVFDAPARGCRGVEDSAPATPGLLRFREGIPGLILSCPLVEALASVLGWAVEKLVLSCPSVGALASCFVARKRPRCLHRVHGPNALPPLWGRVGVGGSSRRAPAAQQNWEERAFGTGPSFQSSRVGWRVLPPGRAPGAQRDSEERAPGTGPTFQHPGV